MIRNISIGIDLGSSTTRVVVREFEKGEETPKIIGAGESVTKGMRHGYVDNFDEAVASVRRAVEAAERSSGLKIKRAFVAIGGMTLRGSMSSGEAIISKADGEVTNLDVKKALRESESNLAAGSNKKVIQEFPISYRLDGKEVLGRVEGMRGTKLEARGLFVTCSILHLEDLLGVITEAGVEPIDIVAAPIAAARIALSEKQKMAGVALVDIGAETVSLAVFENGSPMSLYTSPIASEDITKDIALGLKISLEKAESFKLGNITDDYSKKKLDEIVEARLSDIFESIDNHLKKIKRSGLLPAGVVFVGGGSNIPGLLEFSRSALRLPSSIGNSELFGNSKTKLRDTAWFTALGLVTASHSGGSYPMNSVFGLLKSLKNSLKSSIKQLMP